MADAEAPADETPNQRQARLRREKRAKKMAESGEDRLARIKALNGGVAPPEEVLGGPQPASVADDPDEVDISTASTPSRQNVNAVDNPLAAAMLQMRTEQAQNQQSKDTQDSAENDPMVRMMEQLMGVMGGDPSDPNAKPPDVPPWMKAMLAGGAGIGNGGGENEKASAPPPTGSAYAWRIVHAVFAFALAGYIALTSTFNGTKLSRNSTVYTENTTFGGYGFGPRLFLIFTTAELLLQSSRYFIEKGQLQGGGIIARVANSGFVPEPWAGYIRIFGRYLGIAQTVFQDVMTIVFVFGCLAWWKGMAVA